MRIGFIIAILAWVVLGYFAFSYNSSNMNDCTQHHDIATCYEAYK